MCGIFGLHFYDPRRQVSLQLVREATDVMRHRGPDDSGYLADGSTGLGHRRLSIIDLAAGRQPMDNEDGAVTVVYNGEIYNFWEIREILLKQGHRFRTNCDTEVIVHAYEEWGTGCLERFNGMFAFILFDRPRRRLWVVRDRLGIKPLYYFQDRDFFVAASEIRALLKTGFVPSALNENVLDAFFSVGYVPGPETMFAGIRKLPPGHFLLVEDGEVRMHEYWDFAAVEVDDEVDHNEALERIDALLQDCVKKRLISDVPVGAFLSGGLDSSFVVGQMDRLITLRAVNTFTVAYHQGYSEKVYAEQVAEQFATDHRVFYLEPENFFSSLENMVRFAEEPIVEPAAIALYHISRLAREHAIVLLSGEGSDEVFGGYYLYQFMAKLERIRRTVPAALLSLLPAAGGGALKLKYRKYLDWVAAPLEQRYQGTSSYLTPSLKKYLYHADFLCSRPTYLDKCFGAYFDKVGHKDAISRMLYVDTKTWLVDDLLVKADKMTMAASIELRVPFLDHRLVEAMSALPPDFKIKGGEGKYLLKKISAALLPKQIVYRKKVGFPVPTNEWFRGRLIDEISEVIFSLKSDPWFEPRALDRLVADQKAGREDHSKILMTLLVFAQWRQKYVR